MKLCAINFYKYIGFFTILFFLNNSINAQITSYPYVEDFESGAGSWSLNFSNTSSWQLGTPSASVINSAASGTNAWVTNLDGTYFPDEDGYLLSPEFDFALIANPYVEFSLWWNSEGDWDGAVLQSSTDNQISWQNVGTVGSGTNWFNTLEIASYPGGQPQGWSGSESLDGNDSGGWLTVSQDVFHLIGETSVYFRLVFASDNIIHDEGIGFDLFKVYDPATAITAIPDDTFENYLETHNASGVLVSVGDPTSMGDGIDGNDQVLTSAISGVTDLNIVTYNISNFEGLQYFGNLESFFLSNNQSTSTHSIDFSGNEQLTSITISNVPNLNEVDISQNTNLNYLQINTYGSQFTTIDTSNNLNLQTLIISNNNLSNISLGNNTSIEVLYLSSNPLTEIVGLSSLSSLRFIDLSFTLIDSLNLSNNTLLASLYSENTSLSNLNLKSGFNENLVTVRLENNPNLSCILVDNVANALAEPDWDKDIASTYVENSVSIDTLPQDIPLQYDSAGNYKTDIDEWLANNGGAEATSDCGEITWSYVVFEFFIQSSNKRIVYGVQFIATDVFGNTDSSVLDLTVDNINHFDDEIYGTGDTICDDVFDLNTVITNIDAAASLNASDIASFSFTKIFNGEPNEGPSGVFFADTEVDFPDTGAGSYSYLFKVSVEKALTVYNPTSGNFEEEIFNDEANITLNDKTVAFEVEELDGNTVCSDTISTIQDLTDLLTITPDPTILVPQNGPIDLNQYWTPSVYSGPGTYTFDPTNAFPDCPSNAVSITISTDIEIIQYPQPLIIQYNPNGNEAEIDAWLNNNGGAQVSSCDDIIWSYDLDYYEIDYFDFDDSLICNMIFTATDIFGNQEEFPVILEFQNFAVAGETNQGDGAICGKSINLNGLNGIDFESSVYDNSSVSVSGDGTINGFDVDFPDTGAGSFFYSYSFSVSTNLSIGSLDINVSDVASWTLPNVVIPFDPGEDKIISECNLTNPTLEDLYNVLDVVDGTTEPDFDSNEYWTPSSYQGPGVYTFNAGDFLPDCGGVPTTVTVTPCGTPLSLKVFLEGAYDSNGLMKDDLRTAGILETTSPYVDGLTCNQSVFDVTGNDAIVDWVWIEIRDSVDLLTVISSTSALLQSDGDVVDIDGISPVTIDISSGNYNIMLSHRNHLGILSLNSINFDGSSKNIDFTNSSALVIGGNNAISNLGSGKFGLFAGDFNGDGQIQNIDRNGVVPQRGLSGYLDADIDMNGEVQNTDITVSLNPNLGKGEQFTRMMMKLHAKRKN